MKTAFTRVLAFALLLVMLVSLCACGGEKPEGGKPTAPSISADKPGNTEKPPELATGDGSEAKYGGVVVQAQSVAPGSLFYIHLTGSAAAFVSMCTEPLGRYNAETTHYDPFLCDTFTSDLDACTFTMNVKQGIKFHDGSDLNAEVVAWNLQYMMDNGQGSAIGSPDSVEATDDYTVVVHYPAVALDWADRIGQVLISSKNAFEENGLEYMQNHPVGTGPFVFDEYVPDNYINYVRNDNYWQEGLPYLDGYKVVVMQEWATLMTAFTTGEIDSFNCGDDPTIQTLKAMGISDRTIPDPSTFTAFCIYPNSRIEGDPFYNLKVRQAVMLHGIDWDAAVAMMSPRAICTIQQCIEGSPCYDPALEEFSKYDPELARNMLAEAGYPNGFDTVLYATKANLPLAIAVQDQLKAINVNAEVHEMSYSDTYRQDGVTTGLFFSNGYSTTDYVGKPIGSWYNAGSTMYGKNILFSDEYNSLYEKAMAAKSWEERNELGKQLMRKLHVDECLERCVALNGACIFLSEDINDSGIERNHVTPELAWRG